MSGYGRRIPLKYIYKYCQHIASRISAKLLAILVGFYDRLCQSALFRVWQHCRLRCDGNLQLCLQPTVLEVREWLQPTPWNGRQVHYARRASIENVRRQTHREE